MDNQTFIIKNLSIHRMPGFKQGLEIKEDLDKSIVIVAGPNASGKSSIARMIQKLIWQDETSGILAECSTKIGEETWKIEINSDNVLVQREGIDDDFKTKIPPSEAKSRYMLALHKLINETEESLAKEIIKESIGGYDLDKAEAELDYKDNIKNRGVAELKKCIEIKRNFKKIKKEHKDLKHREENLENLKNEKAEAEHATSLKELYRLYIDYLESQKEFQIKTEKYESFPEAMNKVNGDEYANIVELQKNIDKLENEMKNAERKIEESKSKISKLSIPEKGVEDKTIDNLEQRVDHLSNLEKKVSDFREEILYLQEKSNKLLSGIDDSIDPSKWRGIDLNNVDELDEFLQKSHQRFSEKRFLETQLNEIENEKFNEEINESDILKEGIKNLSYWLEEQGQKIEIGLKEIGILTLIGVVSSLVSYFYKPLSLIGIILIIGYSIYIWKRKRSQTDIRKKDYRKTGLQTPNEWDHEEVVNRLEDLIDELQKTKWGKYLTEKSAQYSNELDELKPRLDRIEEKYNELNEKIGAVPGIEENNLKNYSGLYWFLTNIKEWHKNYAEVEAIKKKKNNKSESLNDELEEINKILNEVGFAEVKDAIEAKSSLNQIDKEEKIRSEEENNINNKQDKINDKTEQKESTENILEDIYEKLNIDIGQKYKVRELTEHLEGFKESKKEYQISENSHKQYEEKLKQHSLYEQNNDKLEELNLDQAENKLSEFEATASKFDNIQKEINETEALVKDKRRGDDLTNALSEKDNALDGLEELYENNLSSITGKLLIDQLKDVIREKNRPLVLKKADEMFNRITAGRYELRVSKKGNEPNFRAFDTTLDKGQDLEEISTGTRIQLLLSTRLAFVETQEPAIKLPILVDELLADSDDQRAGEIIKSLIEISKKGRQIFYFTAQADELAKWKSYLEEYSDIDYSIVKLTEKNSNSFNYDQVDYDFNSLTVYNIPTPENDTHSSYKDKIDLEKFNLLIHKPAGLHIWYLIEEVDLIYNCLKKGVKHWGQLKSYMKHNGIIEGLTEVTIKLIKEKITILEYFQKLYRQGRPIPIDRKDLEDSGAVSEAFIDEVSAKLNEKERNPKQLLKSLNNGEVSRFRSHKIEELGDYLINNKYMDNMEPMEEDEIMIKLNAKLSNLEIDASKAEEFLQRIINYGQE